MTRYKDSPTYKKIREITTNIPASEKLQLLRHEMIRWLFELGGYNELLQELELSGSPQELAKFKKYTGKIGQASLELQAILFGFTDWDESE